MSYEGPMVHQQLGRRGEGLNGLPCRCQILRLCTATTEWVWIRATHDFTKHLNLEKPQVRLASLVLTSIPINMTYCWLTAFFTPDLPRSWTRMVGKASRLDVHSIVVLVDRHGL